MVNNIDEVYLYVPEYEELDYYTKLLNDPNTMNYNSGYDLNIDGYDKETGCIKSYDLYRWYKRQCVDRNRFFAYVVRKSDNVPVGYVNFHFNDEKLKHYCGVVIEGKNRGLGYGRQALKLLCDKAFKEFDLPCLVDDIPYNRSDSLKLFTKLGFKDIKEDFYMKKFGSNERVILLEIKKEDYLDNIID